MATPADEFNFKVDLRSDAQKTSNFNSFPEKEKKEDKKKEEKKTEDRIDERLAKLKKEIEESEKRIKDLQGKKAAAESDYRKSEQSKADLAILKSKLNTYEISIISENKTLKILRKQNNSTKYRPLGLPVAWVAFMVVTEIILCYIFFTISPSTPTAAQAVQSKARPSLATPAEISNYIVDSLTYWEGYQVVATASSKSIGQELPYSFNSDARWRIVADKPYEYFDELGHQKINYGEILEDVHADKFKLKNLETNNRFFILVMRNQTRAKISELVDEPIRLGNKVILTLVRWVVAILLVVIGSILVFSFIIAVFKERHYSDLREVSATDFKKTIE